MQKGKEGKMDSLMIISILAITIIAILTIVDTVRCFKAKKMINASISNCFKAIEKKEGK
jgi:hypothetical protein